MQSLGVCYDMLAAHWLLTASWVERLLSSDVSSRAWPGLGALFWFRCWSETEQKQSLLISHTRPVRVSLLSSSSWNSPFNPTWPPVTILLTLTCHYFQQLLRGPWVSFSWKNIPLPLGCYTLYHCKTFQGQTVQGLPLFTISLVSQYSVCTVQITH